jgi:hypothetical protein
MSTTSQICSCQHVDSVVFVEPDTDWVLTNHSLNVVEEVFELDEDQLGFEMGVF